MTPELIQKLETLDVQLARQGVALTARPYEAHRAIQAEKGVLSSQLYSHAGHPPTLFEEITRWYEARYGERMLIDAKIGEMPFMLRGLVYFFRFPVIYGRKPVNPVKCIQGITADMAQSLTEAEIDYIGQIFLTKYFDFVSLDRSIRNPPAALSSDAASLIKRGLNDVDAANSILKTTGDAQGTIFHTQQAAEKFIKAELLQRGLTEKELRRISHNLKEALDLLIAKDKKFREIEKAVEAINLSSMDIRYKDTGHSIEQAVGAVNAAVHICSTIYDQWWLDERRKGAEPHLIAGRFYGQAIGTYYKCVKVETDATGRELATLIKLDKEGLSCTMRQSTEYAFYYYEITDPIEIHRLENEYDEYVTWVDGEAR